MKKNLKKNIWLKKKKESESRANVGESRAERQKKL